MPLWKKLGIPEPRFGNGGREKQCGVWQQHVALNTSSAGITAAFPDSFFWPGRTSFSF